MTQARKDNNGVPVTQGVLNSDGATPRPFRATPSTHILDVIDGSTGSDAGQDLMARDENGETVVGASDASGNIVPLFIDSNGKLLVKST